MPTYKLTYFNAKARAEIIRLLFGAAGQKFEDRRVDFSEWPELKPKMPQSTLPVLEIDGGKITVSQSAAIARYLAREFKLYGKSNLDVLYIDQIFDTLTDLFVTWSKTVFEKDPEQKELLKKAFEEGAPRYLAIVENLMTGKDGFAVGSGLSLADVVLYNHLDVSGLASNLSKYPKLAANRRKVEQHKNIANYLKTRPVTPF